MREMDAVVARSVVPSAMHIHKAGLSGRQGKMAVCPVHQAAGALTLEVIDHIRERAAFQNVIFYFKWAGNDVAGRGPDLDYIMAILLPRRKIGGPENAVAPCIYMVIRDEHPGKQAFAGRRVYQRKLHRMVRLRANDDCLLGSVRLIANVVHQDTHLSCARRGKRAKATNG